MRWVLFASLALNIAGAAALAYKLATRPSARRAAAYHEARVSLFAVLGADPRSGNGSASAHDGPELVLLGDSLTDWGEWDELLGRPAANRGISGDTTAGVRGRLGPILAPSPPRLLALLIGINDLLAGASVDATAAGILVIAEEVRRRAPATRLIVQSLLPVAAPSGALGSKIARVNDQVAAAAARLGYHYADVGAALRAPDGTLEPRMSSDGLHLSGEGYRAWAAALAPYLEPAR